MVLRPIKCIFLFLRVIPQISLGPIYDVMDFARQCGVLHNIARDTIDGGFSQSSSISNIQKVGLLTS